MENQILIVDDDKPLRDRLQHRLESEGYDVTVCVDGQDAVESLQAGLEPELVVVDEMMPRLDGHGLLQVIRNDGLPARPNIPVIMLTSRSREKDSGEGFESSADDYIAKPFQTEELVVLVTNHLDTHSPTQ
jgi:DNA-binding response OmpR family regulator